MNNYLIPPLSSTQLPATSKFKIGDRVRWKDIDRWNKGYPQTTSSDATVIAVYPEMGMIEVQFDAFSGGNYAVFENEIEHIPASTYGYTQAADPHEGHEIVDNEVMGKAFRFCRHCRVEV
jgi:hypothetical protein